MVDTYLKKKKRYTRSTMHLQTALPVLGALYSPLTRSTEGKEIVK